MPEHPAARGFARWLDERRYPWPALTGAARAQLWARYVAERTEAAQHG